MAKRGQVTARYEEIARDIADKVVRGAYREGERIMGRSTLAGAYKVSPETIRRAVALLHARRVVSAVPGIGIVVHSVAAAREFAKDAAAASALRAFEVRVEMLLEKRRQLDQELGEVIAEMVQMTADKIAAMRQVEEVSIRAESSLVGQTLASANLRSQTGTTVIGIGRAEGDFFAPDAQAALRAGDTLLFIGNDASRARLRALAGGGEADTGAGRD